ncbi:protein with PHD finger [Cryptosporidium sp. chipmunk genotype I]|uniref:protein with PHD finger n=1 Tax=Cryptosporidium sp. chipmunk genotype I TaxID=1280935 RepID=UPI00351A4C16|nr:protein with PHD finger [Cryptosporidium sp. chipmunk genotype I]
MELPSQLKKSNACVIMNNNSEQANTIDVTGKKRLSKNKGSEQVAAIFEVLLQDTAPKLSEFNKINLKKIHLELSKFDSQIISDFCGRVEYKRNCEALLEEILGSNLIIEFGKRISSNDKGKSSENVLIENLVNVVNIIGIFLHFESIIFNEITFIKEIRIISNIIRSVLPIIFSENVKNCCLEALNTSFIDCLETINTIVRIKNIHEVLSTQIIVGLLSIFLIEDINTMTILLAVEIVVHLFVSGSLNSNEFLENSLNLIFNVMEELPQTNKAIKKAKICIEMDSYMHIYVYLLIRLIQSICIPNGIVSNDNILSIKNISIKRYNSAKFICSQFATFFIHNIILNRTKKKEGNFSTGNDIATVILTDLLRASFNPKYNICSIITQIIIIQLIKISNNSLINESGPKSQSIHIDLYSKELCVHLLGLSLSIIYKNVNIKLMYTDSSEKSIQKSRSEMKEAHIEGDDTTNDALIDCVCGSSYTIDLEKLIKCENCSKNFHLNCIQNGTYLEIYEQWKCDSCTINLIFNEINTNFGTGGEEILSSEDSELSVVLITVLDYLYRKTAMTVSQASTEPFITDITKLVTDTGSSVACSFILEMIAKLKLGNKNTEKKYGKEEPKNKTTKSGNKKIFRTCDEMDQLYIMLLTEWVSPITKLHSPLIAYSSKFPKLLEANTIRFWNVILAKELKNVANIILHCLLSNIYNSNVTSIRRISLNSLGQIISVKPYLLITNETVLNAIILSLKDKTPKVRERALAIIEKYFSDISSNENSDYIQNGEDLRINFDRVSKLMLDQIFRTAYDISPLVRMASIKILRGLYHQDPSKLNIGIILLKRASAVEETQTIKRLIFDSFTSIWFQSSSKVDDKMAECLVKLINYSESNEFLQYINHEQKGTNCLLKGVMSILQENQSIKNLESLITRWSNILVDMFIQNDNYLDTIKSEDLISNKSGTKNGKLNDQDIVKSNSSRDFSEVKLQILKTAEVIGKVYPKSIKDMYSYIVVYLKDFRQFKSEVMIHICTVLSYILPYVGDFEADSIEFDLLKIITNSRSPQLIRSSILCLCNLLVESEKGPNENNALSPLIIDNIRILWNYRQKTLGTEVTMDLKEVDQLRRSAWLLGCIFEFSSPNMVLAIVDNKLERAKLIQTEFGISWAFESRPTNKVPESEFGEDLGLEYTILESSRVVFDLLCDLYYTLDWNLNKGVLFPTLIQFLINQKQFVKTLKFNNLIKCAIKGNKSFASMDCHSKQSIQCSNNTVNNSKANSNLCIICLQGILTLLKSYEIQALEENKIAQENDLESSKRVNMTEDITNQFHDEINQSDDVFSGNNSIFSTPNTKKRTSIQFEKNEINSPVSSSSCSNLGNISSIRTCAFGSVTHNTNSVSASQPIASNLELLLNLFEETTGYQEGRFSNQQKQQVSSLILCILEQLNKQGLVNPTSIIPQVSGLLFSSNREVSFKSYQIISSLFERFPNLIINKYKEISVYGFVFCTSNFPGLLGVYNSKTVSENAPRSIISNEVTSEKIQSKSRSEVLETVFEFFTRIYSEKCRSKRVFRESIIRGCCKQLELLLSVDETEILLRKLRAHLMLESRVLLVLYMEFVSYIFLAMPFQFESEILLVLFCLGEICVSCSQNISNDSENPVKIDTEQAFCIAILVTVCTTIQLILKEEYRISDNQISSFNPYNSISKEKPKFLHQDSEFNAGAIENSTNMISLGTSTIYELLQSLREKLHLIWEISESSDSEKRLIDYANEIIYFYTQTTSEKVPKYPKRKQTKRKSIKRNRDREEEFSDTSSTQSWSPSSRTNKSHK